MVKRCKHENADHVGPDAARFAPHALHDVEHLVCLDCDEWLSLGPARDTPRPGPGWHEAAHAMRVEMRLAETLAVLNCLWEPSAARDADERTFILVALERC